MNMATANMATAEIDVTQQLQEAKKAAETMKGVRTRAEADYDNYQKRREELKAEIVSLGVDPEKLQETRDELQAKITDNMQKIWSLIPQQFRS